MLVLSRGQHDKVVFPTLGITVEILRIVGNKVRLGIDAPKEIPVIREEISDRGEHREPALRQWSDGERLNHSVRNRLQKATLGLRLLQRMLEAGQAEDAEPTIFKIFNELKSLEAELAPDVAMAAARGSSMAKRKALVVEDDLNESELLAGYLRLSGFEVDTAMDGLQAIVHLAKNDRPDVVLLDMKLPRFDGRKTVSAIRQNPAYRALRIFAVTGTDRADTAVDIGPQGVDRWFRKPIDPEQLVEAIRDDLGAALAAV